VTGPRDTAKGPSAPPAAAVTNHVVSMTAALDPRSQAILPINGVGSEERVAGIPRPRGPSLSEAQAVVVAVALEVVQHSRRRTRHATAHRGPPTGRAR
jgi:hypothetical protein